VDVLADWDQATVEDGVFHVAAWVDADQAMVLSVCDLAFLALARALAGLCTLTTQPCSTDDQSDHLP
jgi:hypothetical protein